MAPYSDQLLDYIRLRHPRSIAGVLESRGSAPDEFDRIANTFLGWAAGAFGGATLERAADAFARFCSDVNLAQGRYELAGHYENKSFEDCRRSVYDHGETMIDYLWGVFLSNFLWVHHLDLLLFFEQRFLRRLSAGDRLVEIAPGHGGWGLWALHHLPQTRMTGYDISATSIEIATRLASSAGFSDRVAYVQRDAMELRTDPSPLAQACICCFLVEHLEEPEHLLKTVSHLLTPGGCAFFTGALTAAQVDHIYEFRRESELVLLAEQAGLRVLETRSVAAMRQLPNAKFLPRSMALVMQKRIRDSW
jgi:ubiquinone/menaquinone biosynthesis C-methylase UbiE